MSEQTPYPISDPMGSGKLSGELRAPRSAAVAGIAFALILGTVLVLFHSAGPASADGSPDWLVDGNRREQVRLALRLVPFAGIAFLWFIGVLRSRLGDREDKLFATVFLGSGLLFVGMLFTGAALMGAVLVMEDLPTAPPAATVGFAHAVTVAILGTFGARMAAVFTLSATTAGLRTGVLPKWLAIAGYLVALVLLVTPPFPGWSQLLFPGWVLLVSVFILVATARESREERQAAAVEP